MDEKRIKDIVRHELASIIERLDKIERQVNGVQRHVNDNDKKQIIVANEVRREVKQEIAAITQTLVPKINAVASMVKEANYDGAESVTEYRRGIVLDGMDTMPANNRPRRNTFQFHEEEENRPLFM